MTLAYRLLAALLLLLTGSALSAQTPTLPQLSAQLTQAETDLRGVDRAMDQKVDADDQPALRSKAVAARESAGAAVKQLEEQLALIDARIAGLGKAEGGTEAPEIRRQRASLSQERAAVDAAIKRGRLADVEGGQLVAEIDRSQAEELGERLFTRAHSPLAPGFWSAVITSLPRDTRRIGQFFGQTHDRVQLRLRLGVPWQAALGTVLALLLLLPLRKAAQRLGQRFLIEGAPGHRVRRSAYGLWRVLVGTLAPLLAAVAFAQGLRWAGLVTERWEVLLDALVGASGFCGFTGAVTGAFLMRSQPSWRVAPIDDETAKRLRPLSWILAGLSLASILLTEFNKVVGASAAANTASQAAQALLYLLLIGATLVSLGRLRAARAEQGDTQNAAASAGMGAISVAAWLVMAVALVALLRGYVGLASFIAKFIGWGVVLAAAVYLLMNAVDDFALSVFTRQSRLGVLASRALGLRGSAIDQFGLLLSAILRLLLLVIALGLLLSPFGAGGVTAVFGRLGVLAQGVQVGGVSISPGAVLRGILVFVIGLAVVRGVMRWLNTRYLPATELDDSGRNSVSLIVRYVGIALATIWGLASLGIGVERIALLLSALSVGIGFGLQAITQNFVSGLILLAERPIKIGDWIRVGLDEGDVKRISVRSTEIALADHSTLIVPNSELITKSVLNKTLANALGRVQIQFSVPLEENADTVRQMVLDAFGEERGILSDPGPAVFVDAIVDGRILFNCFAHVGSPREAYGVRSSVYMTLLRRFREADIDLGTVPQRFEMVPPPELPDRRRREREEETPPQP